jgi:hypothetical protein
MDAITKPFKLAYNRSSSNAVPIVLAYNRGPFSSTVIL